MKSLVLSKGLTPQNYTMSCILEEDLHLYFQNVLDHIRITKMMTIVNMHSGGSPPMYVT